MPKLKAFVFILVSPLFYTQACLAETGAVKVSATTLGYSINYVQPLTQNLNVRLGVNSFNHERDLEERYLKYNGDFDFKSYQSILEWHPNPNQNWFYLSGGLVYNQNSVTVHAIPKNGTYTINGKDYTIQDVGSLSGKLSFDRASPYFGVGVGNAIRGTKNWTFSAELGVMVEGVPDTTLSVRCGPGLLTGNCAQLQGDVQIEKKYLKNYFEDYKYYPVLGFGIAYRF